MPRNPAAAPINTDTTGTRRLLSLTSACGASPRSARTNSTRELTYNAEFKKERPAVRMMVLMMAGAHGTFIVFSAKVNGDSPDTTVFQGITQTMRNSETTEKIKIRHITAL